MKSAFDPNEMNLPDFNYLKSSVRAVKPRKKGITEIRAAYYSPFGYSYFNDLIKTAGGYIDAIKFAGGAFTLYPPQELKRIIDLAHENRIEISTGGFIEFVLSKGKPMVDQYLEDCRRIGFDIIEISSGFISIPPDSVIELIKKVKAMGMKAKAEVGIQFGAGGASPEAELEKTQNPMNAIMKAEKFLKAGAYMIMMESEGITENVAEWKTEVPAMFINNLGLENLMFEAADPAVFEWYIKNYGMDVNLFVDHSQIIQIEAYRQGIWGTNAIWGRVVGY